MVMLGISKKVGSHYIWQCRQRFPDELKFDGMQLFKAITQNFYLTFDSGMVKPTTKLPTLVIT